MGIDELRQEAMSELTHWQRHRFFVLIIGVILISMVLVSISLSLYNSSGAAQVDLSLPGYQSIQKQASQDRVDTTYPSSGNLDAKAFDSFDTLYNERMKQINASDNYDSRPLSEESLQLLATPATTQAAN